MSHFILSKRIADSLIPSMLPKEDPGVRRKMLFIASLLFLIPAGTLFFLIAGHRYETVNDLIFTRTWKMFLLLFAFICVLFFWKFWKRVHSPVELIFLMFVLLWLVSLVFYGGIHLTNGVFGNSHPRTVEAVVVKKKKVQNTCCIYFEHWDRPGEVIFRRIRNRDMDAIKVNQTRAAFQTRKGYWGFEYYVWDTFRLVNDPVPNR